MPKQTALNTIERLIREERARETDRQPRSGLVTINRLLNADSGGRRMQERPAFNAASAGETMDLVRNMGELAAERRQAEAAPATASTPQGRNRLTPAAQAEFMRRQGAQGQLTPYQQYMMQVSNAQRDALETTEKRQAAGERTTGPYRAPNAYQQYRLGQENRRREEAARVRENMPSGWKDVGNTLGGMAAGFVSGVGNPLAVMARIMEMLDDIPYAITKNERFNLDRAPGLRDSAALRASDDFSAAAQEAADKAGPLGKMLISGAEAAGNMMSSAGIYGQALGSIANAGGAARLAEIAESSPLLTSQASRRGAKMALDILSNPGNFGISLGSGVNSYSRALENRATVDQAIANGVSKGLLEYFSNKMFSGTPFEDAAGEKGYVTRLVEHLADRIGASGILEAFNRSTGGKVVNWILDKAGEGMEETITGFGEPLIDRITYNPKADLATADELADEFLGGVILSLLLSGGERLSSWQKSGNGISEREVIDRLEEMGIPSEIAREYATQTAQAASVLINAEKPVPPSLQRAVKRPTKAPLTLPEDRGTMETKAYKFGNSKFYGIETSQGVRTFTRRNAEFIQGGQLYVSDNGNYLVSVNPDGSVRGFAALSAKLPPAAKQVGFGKLKGVGPGIQKGVAYGAGEGTEGQIIRTESPVSGGLEESQGAGQGYSAGGVVQEKTNGGKPLESSNSERADRVKAAAITPKEGTVERQYQDKAQSEYGIKTNTIPKNVWETEFGKDAPEFRSRKGEIYAKEGFTKEEADIGFPHEITHIMKQVGFEPYLRLLEEAPDYVDFNDPQMRDILDVALEHIGATFEDLTDDYTINRLYDELMATVYGLAINGKTSGKTDFAGYVDFRNIFNDFDGLIQRLKELHNDFKIWRTQGKLRISEVNPAPEPEKPALKLKGESNGQVELGRGDAVRGSDVGRRGSELSAEQTPWQEYREGDNYGSEFDRIYRGGNQGSRTLLGNNGQKQGGLQSPFSGGKGAGGAISEGVLESNAQQRENRLKAKTFKSAAINPPKGTPDYFLKEIAKDDYGVSVVIVKANIWDSYYNKETNMASFMGEIYAREGLTQEDVAIGLPHEMTHIMKQSGYAPYISLVRNITRYFGTIAPMSNQLFQEVLQHVNLSEDEIRFNPRDTIEQKQDKAIKILRVNDELLATMFGEVSNGKISGVSKNGKRFDYRGAFMHLEELAQRLKEMHADFQTWNKKRKSGKASTESDTHVFPAVASGDMETAQLRIPAEQTPWQEYLEWYTRQIGELTRRQLSPPEERETVWQRYLRQYEKEREIEKALKTVEILGTVPEEYAELLEEAPGTDALVALRHWEDRRRRNK